MLWTKVDWEPPVPRGITEGGAAPEMAAMGMLVNVMRLFMKKRPDPVYAQRGQMGIELADEDNAILIKRVLPESAAAKAGLKEGDRVTRYQMAPVKTLAELHALAAEHAGTTRVNLEVVRDGKPLEITVETEKGL
jgi:S1-C subfamily serine protease